MAEEIKILKGFLKIVKNPRVQQTMIDERAKELGKGSV